MAAHSEATPGGVEMLPGVPHYETSGFAATWEAYDALTETDGWVEKFGDLGARWKQNTIDGRNLLVHAPLFARSADS